MAPSSTPSSRAPRRDDVGFVDHICEPTAEAHQSKRVRRDHRLRVELQYNTRDLKLNPQDFVVFPIAESSKILTVVGLVLEIGTGPRASWQPSMEVVADKNASANSTLLSRLAR